MIAFPGTSSSRNLYLAASLAVVSSCSTSHLILENERLHVEISEKGAELCSIHDKRSDAEILWIGDRTYWDGQAPVMFPVNVRMKDDHFSYNEKVYQMPMLGLAKNQVFKVDSNEDAGSASFSMSSSELTRKHFPFEFRLVVTYQLKGNALINRFRVTNAGKETMYFALGGHPGFYCPHDDGKTRGDYEIVFPRKWTTERIEVAGNYLQDKRIPFLQNEDRLSLDDARVPNGGMFLKESGVGQVGLAEKGKPPFVTVDLGDFPNVNIWTPPGFPFACIEPMVSHHDVQSSPVAIEEKAHLVSLPAGESRSYRFTIIVHGR